MRGDGVGIGDVDEVPGGRGGTGIEAGSSDGRGARRERDTGMERGRVRAEHGAGAEHCSDRGGVGDSAGGRDGHGKVHGQGARGSDGVRGIRLGI